MVPPLGGSSSVFAVFSPLKAFAAPSAPPVPHALFWFPFLWRRVALDDSGILSPSAVTFPLSNERASLAFAFSREF